MALMSMSPNSRPFPGPPDTQTKPITITQHIHSRITSDFPYWQCQDCSG